MNKPGIGWPEHYRTNGAGDIPKEDFFGEIQMAMQDIARSVHDLERVLHECRRGFELRKTPAAAASDQWSMIDGALQHRSRGFFSVNGITNGEDSYVLLYQPQAAVTGLITAVIGGERCYLLQGRAEPGCLGEAQFGPTVQSTPANYMRMHGGAATPYIHAFIEYDPNVSVIDDTTQLDLGERYIFKSKRSILLETGAAPEPQSGFVWATGEVVAKAADKSAFLNLDLRSILAVSCWSSSDDGAGILSPRSSAVRKSLEAEIRSDVMGRLISELMDKERPQSKFVPLSNLSNWRETEMGWEEREPRQGFAVDFFHVTAAHREVGGWVQPLINSASEGDVVLACRERKGALEFYVRVVKERGLATSKAIAPSFVRYPGRAGGAPEWLSRATTWSATVESDEGGRFYRDASHYRIVRSDDQYADPEEGSQGLGAWVRLSELKLLLRMSNFCTIQLRAVVSQLLSVA